MTGGFVLLDQRPRGGAVVSGDVHFVSRLILLAVFVGLVACAPPGSLDTGGEKVSSDDVKLGSAMIYGDDGRKEVYQASALQKQLAASTVALFKTADLGAVSSGSYTIKGQNYGTWGNLCSSERFREQSAAAFCSGSLVGPDLILTAGHCITSSSDCASTSFVFGFGVFQAGVLPQRVAQGEVYKCREIVSRQLQNAGTDYALIRLDRAAANKSPLPIRRSGEVRVGQSLVVIGHPSGLPTKVTDGGKVRSVASTGFFVASVDTYGGNSGSAVFDASSGVIEGILVRGDNDFVSQGGCNVSNKCSEDGCRGEDVTRVSEVARFIPALGGSQPQPSPEPQPAPGEKYGSSKAVAIPDNNKTGASSSISVSKSTSGKKIRLQVEIEHPYVGDLVVQVANPEGKSLVVHNREGGGKKNLSLDVEISSLATSRSGSWKLSVSDLAASDKGSLKSWSLSVSQ